MAGNTNLNTVTPTTGSLKRGMNVKVKMLGAKELAKATRMMTPAARKGMANALFEEAGKVIGTAMQHYVPVDTGALMQSGGVMRHGGTYPTVEFGFGSHSGTKDTTHYAVIQHENMWFRHRFGGQAKYLAIPLNRAKPRIRKRLAMAIRYELGKFDTRKYS